MNLQERMAEINGAIQSTSRCLYHGGYNHDAVCHVPELLEIAKEYLALLSILDSDSRNQHLSGSLLDVGRYNA
jgi:hypothetical protein